MGGLADYFGADITDNLKAFSPTEHDKQQAMNMGLLQAGLGMLASNRGYNSGQALSNAIGQGGIHGLNAYQNNIADVQKEQMRQLGLAQMMEGYAQKKRQQEALQKATPDVQEAVAMGVPISEIWKNKNAAYNLAPGEKRMQGNSVVADGGPKMPEWAIPGPDGGMVVNPAWLKAKKEIAAAGRAVSNTNVFNNTKDDFKNERDLRNDFAGLPTTKAFNEVQSAYDQINVAIKKESPAGDLAAGTKIMKLLDPGSVVRESELGMAMAATGAMDRIQNYAEMTMKGTKLTPKQRQDFSELASQLYRAAADRYDVSAKEYQSVASDYKLNPQRVAKPSQRSAISSGGWSASVVK